jgi:uncharacterized protein (DUF362 family)
MTTPTVHAKGGDIAVVEGDTASGMVRKAIALLGGIENHVKKGDRVVLLPNPQGGRPGVSTNAEMVAETIHLCVEAGAAEVTVASIHPPERWFSAGIKEAVDSAGSVIHWPQSDQDWIEVSVERGEILGKVRIVKRAVENDLLINMPIAKQHDSTGLTCTLKNLMGFHANNRPFHQGAGHLHRCIVDLATLFSPGLLIVDATTVLAENGPFGPGRVISPNKVVAGTDMVAVDALCCGLFQMTPNQIPHIVGSHEMGLGEIDLSQIKIQEIQI